MDIYFLCVSFLIVNLDVVHSNTFLDLGDQYICAVSVQYNFSNF